MAEWEPGAKGNEQVEFGAPGGCEQEAETTAPLSPAVLVGA
jgi:hypothetical protein